MLLGSCTFAAGFIGASRTQSRRFRIRSGIGTHRESLESTQGAFIVPDPVRQCQHVHLHTARDIGLWDSRDVASISWKVFEVGDMIRYVEKGSLSVLAWGASEHD